MGAKSPGWTLPTKPVCETSVTKVAVESLTGAAYPTPLAEHVSKPLAPRCTCSGRLLKEWLAPLPQRSGCWFEKVQGREPACNKPAPVSLCKLWNPEAC